MQDVMFPNDPVEAREQMLRDNCDQYCDKTIDAVLDKIRGVAPDIAIIEA